MNPQDFGKQFAFVGMKSECDQSRFIYVPVRFTAENGAAAGDRVFSDIIDLTTFTQGAPSPFVKGVQSLIVFQRCGTDAAITSDAFLSEFIFDSQFKCFAPGRAYTALTVLASQYPKINLNVYAQQAVSADTEVNVDIYFGNFQLDDINVTPPAF